MKNIKLLLLALFIALPMNVKAFDLKCDGGAYTYDQEFKCYFTAEPNLYDQISGTITSDDSVACEITEQDPNLSGTAFNTGFNLSGTIIKDKSLMTVTCKVKAKSPEGKQAQLVINDFTYHVKDTTYLPSQEVIRSNYITIAPYVEQTEVEKDDKPRDLSNPASRIKSIYDEQLDYTFSTRTAIYNIEVLYEVEQLNLVVYTNNPLATYRIVGNDIEGNQKLEVGENVIDVYATSPDGTSTTCYTLYITRLARGQTIYYPKEDSTLSNLVIAGHDIKFEPIILEYQVSVDHTVNKLSIEATPTYSGADVEIKGNEKLHNGKKIAIIVTNANGTESTRYEIIVKKSAPPKDYKQEIIAAVIFILIAAVMVVFIITMQRNKNDDLLKLKHDKRKVKRGKNFDVNSVEEVSADGQLNKVVAADKPQNIVITENNVAEAIQVTEQVDTNLNKVTPVQANVELTASAAAQPIQVTEPVVVENTIVSGLGEQAPTLDLTTTNVESAIIQPVPEQNAFNMVATPVEQTNVVPVVETPVIQEVIPQMVEPQVIEQPVVIQPQVAMPVQEAVVTPVVEAPVAPEAVQQPIIEPQVVPQVVLEPTPAVETVVETPVVAEPIIEQPVLNDTAVIEEQNTSILPITPTEYVLPEDQELQATQQLRIAELQAQNNPEVMTVTPPQE